MAISWGAWEYSGGNGMRTGIEISRTGVDTNSGSVTWTIWTYTQNQYAYSDNQVVSYWGNIGGSTSYNNSGAANTVTLRSTLYYTYNYSTWGSSPGSVSFGAEVSGAYNGVTPGVEVWDTIPARPYDWPYAPVSVNAVRNSDSQATVSWGNNTNAQRPWTSLTVQMATYSGSSWGAWETVATTSGGATSYVKTGLSSNRVYQFRVQSHNSIGSSGFVDSPNVTMTPAAPSAVASVLNAGGTSITTTWQNNHYVEAGVTLEIQRSVGGGAYANVATGLSWSTTTWTDNSPGAGTNTYRIRSHQSVGSLGSAYATGNTVSTIVPPLAPTLLSPNGTRVDLTTPTVLTWQHNPGGDGAAQTQYTIEYSTNGGSTWVALPSATAVVSAASTHTIAANTLANSATAYQWRVRTKAAAAAFGPDSAAATFTGHLTPVVNLTAPTATTTALPLVATWTYTQPQGSAQAAWQATLYEDTGVGGLVELEVRSGTGTTLTTTFTYPVVDGANYVVKLQAQSAGGQWSNLDSQATLIDLPQPAEPVLTGEYQLCTGTIMLSISSLAPLVDEIAIDTVALERRVEGGDWVQLVSDLELPPGGLDFIDTIPLTRGLNEYRVTATSSAPSYRVSPIVTVEGVDGTRPYFHDGLWVFLAYGPAFSKVLRFKHDPSIKESAEGVRSAQPFLGRKKPVLLAGANVQRTVGVSGSLYFDRALTPDPGCRDDSPPNDWLTASQDAVVVAYRDYTGRRIFGMLSGVDTSDGVPGISSVSFTVTEVDYVEKYG